MDLAAQITHLSTNRCFVMGQDSQKYGTDEQVKSKSNTPGIAHSDITLPPSASSAE